MTAADHLEGAGQLIDQAVGKIDSALPNVPHYSLEACRFARAELAVVRRRIGNLRKVLSSGNVVGRTAPPRPRRQIP